MALRLEATHDTGLVSWTHTRLTALLPSGTQNSDTGTLVLWGKSTQDGAAAFHVFQGHVGGWRKLTHLPGVCAHDVCVNIKGIRVVGQDLLSISCRDCGEIRLGNVHTGDITTAFYGSRASLGATCLGAGSHVFVALLGKEVTVVQLDASTAKFKPQKNVRCGGKSASVICHIPGHNLIVVCGGGVGECASNGARHAGSRHSGWVRAVSCENGKAVWEVRDPVEGAPCSPVAVAHCPEFDTLLIADGAGGRVVVLGAWDGSLRQVLTLGEEVGVLQGLSLLQDDQVLLLHSKQGKQYVSYYSVY